MRGDVATAELVLELGEALDRTLTPQAACDRALESLLTAVAADGAAVVLDGIEGWAPVRSERGRPEELRQLEQRAVEAAAARTPLVMDEQVGFPAVAAAIVEGDVCRGRLVACRARGPFSAAELVVLKATAALVARTVGRLALVEEGRRAKIEGARSAAWMQRLVRVSAKLSSAFSMVSVAEVIVSEGFDAIGADNGAIWLLDPARTRLEMLASRGYAPEMKARFSSFPLVSINPLCHAVEHATPVWIEHWADFVRLFPDSEAGVRGLPRPPEMSFACLPLEVDGKAIGGLSFTFLRARPFEPDERTFIGLLGQQCARGIERADLYDRALNAVRVRDDFLSVAGHELRTPLSALLLQAEVLLRMSDDTPKAAIRERGALVLRGVTRLIKLTDELLDTSRITTGRLSLRREPVELGALVEEVVARTGGDGTRIGPNLRFEVTGPVQGYWDRARIEQVVTNLLTNALRYGGGEPIEVRVTRSANAATITVRDRGIGIGEDDQARIFDRFERAGGTNQFGGLGLGLWITREIVEAHGGRITVDSRLGEGATFTVTLPITER